MVDKLSLIPLKDIAENKSYTNISEFAFRNQLIFDYIGDCGDGENSLTESARTTIFLTDLSKR